MPQPIKHDPSPISIMIPYFASRSWEQDTQNLYTHNGLTLETLLHLQLGLKKT